MVAVGVSIMSFAVAMEMKMLFKSIQHLRGIAKQVWGLSLPAEELVG